jgi:type II secretory pathway component PulC
LPITGGYEISGTSAGEFLYELGLRNGDIPESINTMPLETAQDTIDAFIDLYLEGETEFGLDVLRSSSTSTLYYKFY